MSEDVLFIGKLIKVEPNDGENQEDQVIRILFENDIEPCKSSYTDYIDQLECELYKKYVVHDDVIYKVEMTSEDVYVDIFESHKNEDESIDFVVKYYNGGCSFNEAIAQALDNET